jgi:hypothetical protein
MLAPDTFFNQFDHAVMHDKLHHHFAVETANQHLAQQPVNNAVKLDELLVVHLAEYESSRWSSCLLGLTVKCVLRNETG